MIVETISGSRYEIDLAGKRARREYGPGPATKRMPDGVWREFIGTAPLEGPVLGKRMFFEWADESVGPTAAEGSQPGTITTPVFLICL